MDKSDVYWMQEAFKLAHLAKSEGEVPVGAVLVDEHNQLVSGARNQVIQNNDPCAHAEILAIREAGRSRQNYRLNHTTLYVTLEPCAMCAGALVHARIDRLVFAARDVKAGAAGSAYNLLSGKALNHKIQIDEGVLESECSSLLRDFFRDRR